MKEICPIPFSASYPDIISHRNLARFLQDKEFGIKKILEMVILMKLFILLEWANIFSGLPPLYPRPNASSLRYLHWVFATMKALESGIDTILSIYLKRNICFQKQNGPLCITIHTIWYLPEIINTKSLLCRIKGTMISSYKLQSVESTM